jgi:hypothetical protein
MADLQNSFQLQKSLLEEGFILKTQQQIAKDFAKVNLNFPESFILEPFSKEEIIELIANEVATFMERGERHLLQLLYSVDLSEKGFLELTVHPEFLANISEQILYREAYKVWLRANYSK